MVSSIKYNSIKKIFASVICLVFISSLFILSPTNMNIDAASSIFSDISNDKILAVEHKTPGALDTEITAALQAKSMTATHAQLLVISGSARLNDGDWDLLRNGAAGLTGLSSLFFDGYTAEDAIPDGVFSGGNEWIVNLKLSKSFRTIGKNAFNGCVKLKNVQLEGVTTISEGTFANSGVSSVDMPEVVSIKSDAFTSCKSLKTINAPKVQTIDKSAFYFCSVLNSLYFPELLSIGANAFEACTAIKDFLAPKLQTIDSNAFYGASAMTQLIVGSLSSVGTGALQSSSSSLTIYHQGPLPSGIPSNSNTMEYTGTPVFPQNQTVAEGSSIGLSVGLNVAASSGYKLNKIEWYKGSALIVNQNGPTLPLPNVRQADVGLYHARLTFVDANPPVPPATAKPTITFKTPDASVALIESSLEAIAGLPAEYKMNKGDSVTWNPTPTGGSWSYERSTFEYTKTTQGATFKAVGVDGKYTITYTAPNRNVHKINVTIGEVSSSSGSSNSSTSDGKTGTGGLTSSGVDIPKTGEGLGIVYVSLTFIAVAAISVALIFTLRRKRK